MKITPSARILKMLGEIEFAEWQCVAELVDNAFDDFAELHAAGTPWAGGYQVSVSLPKAGRAAEATLTVRDTGRGMSKEHLEQAVRAGWSSNDQFDKLGLFGMGFNVSTARLGRKTRILTARVEDPEWIGVEIDLDHIGDDFEAPDITEPKQDPTDHGTRIEISKLDPDRADWLQRNGGALRRQLGHVYSWLLDQRPFELWVGGIRVTARKPCHWDESRSVTYGSASKAEIIPAVIRIDQQYAPAETCLVCGNWQQVDLERCEQCDSTLLVERERRLHGWLGIQRYLDRSEYGVDFLRNGRKILMGYKGIFEWSDPNDPMAAVLVEYPTELGQGGRIIGEIHLDHVPVNYQKNAFEFSDKQWKQAIAFLRGHGPLLPQKAKELGYGENVSVLGRLVKGYRRNDPGSRYLIPGDGKAPLHDKAKVWAQKFYAGDPDYQTDEIWWKHVQGHESAKAAFTEAKAGAVSGSEADEAALLKALGLSPDNGSGPSPIHPGPQADVEPSSPAPAGPPKPKTAHERAAHYASVGREAPDLSGDLGHPNLGYYAVTSWLVDEPVVSPEERRVPVWANPASGGAVQAFVDVNHRLFDRYGWSFRDAVLLELASLLRVRAESSDSLASVVEMIQASSLPDSALDLASVANEGRGLLADVRQLVSMRIAEDPQRAYQWLTPDEVQATENAMIAANARGAGALADDPRFVLFAPAVYLVRLIEEWPEAFMDGLVFRGPYADLEGKESKRMAVNVITALMSDAAQLTAAVQLSPLQLQRMRLSVLLLREEVIPTS